MDRFTVEKRIKEIIVEKTKIESTDTIENSAPLDEYVNSITYIQLLIAIEDEYDLDLDDEVLDLVKFRNLDDVLSVICEMMQIS